VSWPICAPSGPTISRRRARRHGLPAERAVAFRAIGQFRLASEGGAPAARPGRREPGGPWLGRCCRWSCSRATTRARLNSVRSLLHKPREPVDGNAAVRRLAIVSLAQWGRPSARTIVLLDGLAEDDEAEPELRNAAAKVSQTPEAQAEAPAEEVGPYVTGRSWGRPRARMCRPHEGQFRRCLRRFRVRPFWRPACAMSQPALSVYDGKRRYVRGLSPSCTSFDEIRISSRAWGCAWK